MPKGYRHAGTKHRADTGIPVGKTTISGLEKYFFWMQRSYHVRMFGRAKEVAFVSKSVAICSSGLPLAAVAI